MKLALNTLLVVIAAVSQSCVPMIPPPPCMVGGGPSFNNGPRFAGPPQFINGPQFIGPQLTPQPFFDGGGCGDEINYGPATPAYPGQYGWGPQSFVPGAVDSRYGKITPSTAVWLPPRR